jgi:hypothetical protein
MASKRDAAKTLKALANDIESQDVAETPEQYRAAQMQKTDTKGAMLMCEFTLAKREGAPDPLVITVNKEIKWLKRGATVKLPWYFVEHMLNNIERKFRQEKGPDGKKFVVYDDMPTEAFSYLPINPAIDPKTNEPFRIEGPRPVVNTTL